PWDRDACGLVLGRTPAEPERAGSVNPTAAKQHRPEGAIGEDPGHFVPWEVALRHRPTQVEGTVTARIRKVDYSAADRRDRTYRACSHRRQLQRPGQQR